MGHASTLFNGNASETLIDRITPSNDQRAFLQLHWNNLADHLKTELYEKHGYPISSWIQGSYKFATLIKPLQMGEYDVDVGLFFEWDQSEELTPTPAQLREWVQAEIYEYKKICNDLETIDEPAKERCSRARYKRQFHIDTPVYQLNTRTDIRRLACLSNKWENSDPKAIYKWFRDAVSEGDREQLRRLVRYLKAWAAVSFDEAPLSRPSSIFLTVLAAEAFRDLWSRVLSDVADDDALSAVVGKIHARIIENRKVWNPIDEREDLNRLDDNAWNGFLPRLQALNSTAERAKAALDEAGSALIWSEAFSFLMPLPETEEVEVVDQASGHAVMQLPEIDIEVYAKNPRRLIARHRNEVPSVSKDCDVIFRIVNSHVVPDYAVVEWTVRNEGEEADASCDLGHRTFGMRALTAEEHTGYVGRHFMDCVIRQDGQIYAVRRVPVRVNDSSFPARNPPRPAYTKIRSFLRKK